MYLNSSSTLTIQKPSPDVVVHRFLPRHLPTQLRNVRPRRLGPWPPDPAPPPGVAPSSGSSPRWCWRSAPSRCSLPVTKRRRPGRARTFRGRRRRRHRGRRRCPGRPQPARVPRVDVRRVPRRLPGAGPHPGRPRIDRGGGRRHAVDDAFARRRRRGRRRTEGLVRDPHRCVRGEPRGVRTVPARGAPRRRDRCAERWPRRVEHSERRLAEHRRGRGHGVRRRARADRGDRARRGDRLERAARVP